MRLAVGLPQIGDDVEGVVRAAREAEDAGAWGVWVFDNLAPILRPDRPALEGWSLLGPLARATSRVRLVSLVTRAGLRPPALVVRMAAVVQAASHGRLVVGLGAGDAAGRREERRFGVGAPAGSAERRAHIEETIDLMRSPVRPVRPEGPAPPVWVGGASADLVELAARRADAWHGWGLTPERFARCAARVRTLARRPVECWWGGTFDPALASGTAEALRRAGADGITWMVPSRHDGERRPELLRLVRSTTQATQE